MKKHVLNAAKGKKMEKAIDVGLLIKKKQPPSIFFVFVEQFFEYFLHIAS